jgi:hypothetical protein
MVEVSDETLKSLKETMDILLQKHEDAIEAIDALVSAVGLLGAVIRDMDSTKSQKALAALKIMATLKEGTKKEQKATVGALKILSKAFQHPS